MQVELTLDPIESVADTFGPEVLVADADVLLGDACDVLASGQRSRLLRAIDAGAAIGVMSEQAFHELGWMSAKAARGRGVDHDDLRAVIEADYLPRIPVVRTPAVDSLHWMPDASDISDPGDVPHVQVARLINARAVYSHDKHLRRPLLAPATRPDFDQRFAHLLAAAAEREVAQGTVIGANIARLGLGAAVTWTSARLRIAPPLVWLALASAGATATYRVLSEPERRQRVAEGLQPLIGQAAAIIDRGSLARRELSTTRLIATSDTQRLESQLARHLIRSSDSPMRALSDELALSRSALKEMSSLLRSHPSFELTSRYGWSVGNVRNRLATHPSLDWRQRPPT